MRRFTPATVLIVLVFGAASVLAWQAYQSARSHRQSAERVLTDYVQFAAWELERASQASLEDAIAQWSQPVCGTGGALLTPAEFNARPACKCSDLRAVTLFRQAGPELETTGEPLSAATTAWLTSVTSAAPGSLPTDRTRCTWKRAGAAWVVVHGPATRPERQRPCSGIRDGWRTARADLREVVARRPCCRSHSPARRTTYRRSRTHIRQRRRTVRPGPGSALARRGTFCRRIRRSPTKSA